MDMTPPHLSETPKQNPSSSSGKTRNPMDDNVTLKKVKKRLADWKMNHAVSGPGGKFMSFEQNKAANEELCSPGEFKSSALMRALEVRSKLEQEFPSFEKSLVRSDVASCFWMGLPGAFCKLHLPKKDSTMVLEDEAGRQFQVKYIAHKTGLSAGWRQFSAAHKLTEGNVLVFQLVGPTKFKVHVIRARNLTKVDDALGLQNLDSCIKYYHVEKGTKNTGDESSDNVNKKHTKSLPLNVAAKIKKPTSLRPFPRQRAEHSEDVNDEVGSKVLRTFKLSHPTPPFRDVKSFEDFNIIVDGQSINSEIPKDTRKRYYKLCCSQNILLHEHLIPSMNRSLIVGAISETITIADAIKGSSLWTSRDELVIWDRTLRALELFGMNVGFLRARLRRLASLASESKSASLNVRKSPDAKNEQSHVEDEIRNIETKFVELKEACDIFGVAIGALNSTAEVYKAKPEEEASAP